MPTMPLILLLQPPTNCWNNPSNPLEAYCSVISRESPLPKEEIKAQGEMERCERMLMATVLIG